MLSDNSSNSSITTHLSYLARSDCG